MSDSRQYQAAQLERAEASLADTLQLEGRLRAEHEGLLEELRDLPLEGSGVDELHERLRARAHELRPMLEHQIADLRGTMLPLARAIINIDLDHPDRTDLIAVVALSASDLASSAGSLAAQVRVLDEMARRGLVD
jgi:hypothetical protein